MLLPQPVAARFLVADVDDILRRHFTLEESGEGGREEREGRGEVGGEEERRGEGEEEERGGRGKGEEKEMGVLFEALQPRDSTYKTY